MDWSEACVSSSCGDYPPSLILTRRTRPMTPSECSLHLEHDPDIFAWQQLYHDFEREQARRDKARTWTLFSSLIKEFEQEESAKCASDDILLEDPKIIVNLGKLHKKQGGEMQTEDGKKLRDKAIKRYGLGLLSL